MTDHKLTGPQVTPEGQQLLYAQWDDYSTSSAEWQLAWYRNCWTLALVDWEHGAILYRMVIPRPEGSGPA